MLGLVVFVVIVWFAIGFAWISDERYKQQQDNAKFIDEMMDDIR